MCVYIYIYRYTYISKSNISVMAAQLSCPHDMEKYF